MLERNRNRVVEKEHSNSKSKQSIEPGEIPDGDSSCDSTSSSTPSSINDKIPANESRKQKRGRSNSYDLQELYKGKERAQEKRRSSSRGKPGHRRNDRPGSKERESYQRKVDQAKPSQSNHSKHGRCDYSNYQLDRCEDANEKYSRRGLYYSDSDKGLDEAIQVAKDIKNARMKSALNIRNDRDLRRDKPKSPHRRDRISAGSPVRIKPLMEVNPLVSHQDSQYMENYDNTLFTNDYKIRDGYCADCNIPFTGEKAPEHFNTQIHYKNTSGKFRCQICLTYNHDIKAHLAENHVEDVFDCNLCQETRSSYRSLEMRKMLDHFYNFHPKSGNNFNKQQLPNRNDLLKYNDIRKPQRLECFGCKLCNLNLMCGLEKVVEHQLLEDGVQVAKECDIRFTCRVCGISREFADHETLIRHIEEDHTFKQQADKTQETSHPRSRSPKIDARLHFRRETSSYNEVDSAKSSRETSRSHTKSRNSWSPLPIREKQRSFTETIEDGYRGHKSSRDSLSGTRISPVEKLYEEAAASRIALGRDDVSLQSLESRTSNKSQRTERSRSKQYERKSVERNAPLVQYPCYYCPEEFGTIKVRQYHISMQHNDKLFTCDIECTSFNTNGRRAMLEHLDRIHYYTYYEDRARHTTYLKGTI